MIPVSSSRLSTGTRGRAADASLRSKTTTSTATRSHQAECTRGRLKALFEETGSAIGVRRSGSIRDSAASGVPCNGAPPGDWAPFHTGFIPTQPPGPARLRQFKHVRYRSKIVDVLYNWLKEICWRASQNLINIRYISAL